MRLPPLRPRVPLLLALAFGLLPGPGRAQPTAPDAARLFEAEVRPVLVSACQRCHGPKKQEGGLRLDSRAALLKGGDGGPAVVAGDPDKSPLVRAVRRTGDVQMPPGKPLRPDQVAALARWVERGAPWPDDGPVAALTRSGPPTAAERRHWAFRPVAEPPVPAVRDAAWPLTPIDRFVRARLEKEGLTPVPVADRRTLLRRVTFDLTGLPPTPDEIDAFLADDSPRAFDRVVDRLLASPHYGERWGRHWLDVVRYADTAGDGADYPVREAYRYRDYVTRAFNRDVPFDAFLREQIAGDLLAREAPAADPERYADLLTAPGFLAVSKRYGYNVNTAFQHLDLADTIDGVGQAVLGLTLGCARCHDHKYDPVTAADYYALYGIFASTQFAFPGGEELQRPRHFVPLLPPAEVAKREAARKQELAGLDRELKAAEAERQKLLGADRFAGGLDLAFEGQKDGAAPGAPWFAAGPNVVTAEAQSPFAHVHPAGRRGLRLRSGAPGDGIRQAVTAAAGGTLHFNVDFRNVDRPEGGGSYRFYLGHGAIHSMAVECCADGRTFVVRNGRQIESVRPLETGAWYNLQLTLDLAKRTYRGRIGRPGDVVEFADKAFAPGWDGTIDTFFLDGTGHVAGVKPVHDVDNLGFRAEPFAPVTAGPVAARPAPAGAADRAKALARLDAAVAELKKKQAAVNGRELYPVAYGVAEGKPANARIQKRGEPERPGPEVPRRFLEVLGGDALPRPDAGSGRRELADWLTRPTNPLTARVLVNRVWQHHFGRGLVATPNDFGTRGDPPSHPELLDYLAARFMAEGWSIKTLHRQILRSRVYQLASADTAANLRADPDNRLLWKQARRRLDAEALRDAMLAVGGRLDRAAPGPHPFPDVNTWGFTIHYPFAAVYESNHRSIYLMVQRARRHPYLALFDGADPNLSTPERRPTTTPLQALYLMNAPFVHDQAAGFARRLLDGPGDDAGRVRRAYTLSVGREATADEVADAVAFVARYRERLGAGSAADPAWAALGRVLLTSNAFLFVD